MNVQNAIRGHGAAAVCRAVSNYVSGSYAELKELEIDGFETMAELREIMGLAYDALQPFQQMFFTQALSELEELALIEAALGNMKGAPAPQAASYC